MLLANRNHRRLRSRARTINSTGLLCLALISLVLLMASSTLILAQPKLAKAAHAPARIASAPAKTASAAAELPAKAEAAPAEPGAVTGDSGLFDIDATATDIKFVLEALARRSGANIVVSPDISGDISAHVKQQSVDSILDLLSAVQGFAWKKSGDTYLVSTKEKLAVKPAADEAVPPEPKTAVWNCRHARPADLVMMVGKLYPNVKVAEGPTRSQPKLGAAPTSSGASLASSQTSGSSTSSTDAGDSGSLVIIGTPDDLTKVQALLGLLDAPSMQVSIDVAITEISSGSAKNLGIDWSWSDMTIKEGNSGDIGFGKFAKSGMTFTGAINALIQTNGAKLLAQPNILVIDGANAEILIGDRILFPKLVGYNQVGAPIYDKDEERVGIYLQLAVKVLDDGQIIMTLYPQVSLVTKYLTTSAGSYPQISTREARTTVSVKDGSTLAIGGLIQDNDITEGTSVPLLGKLPIIGQLFRRNKTTKDHSELVIFLTPKIVKQS